MGRIINPNLLHLVNSFKAVKNTKPKLNISIGEARTLKESPFIYRGSLLEGSSRSGKTWSSVDFLVWLCSKVETDCTINIIKETYNSFKTTLYDDFNRRLPMYGIQSPFADRQEVAQFKLFGNKINLLGADRESVFDGNSCDYAYFNEMLDIKNNVFDQTEQRCRKYWWGDYNPKATDHWVYKKVAARPNVSFLKTTFLDNPYLSAGEKEKILSYEPTHPDDREELEKNRRPHPTNILAGTADDYRWKVYGLGERAAPEGLIFPYVKWLDKFPENIEHVYYGSDVGFTNSPSTIVKVGIDGSNMYLEKLFHCPTPYAEQFVDAVSTHVPKDKLCVIDSADGRKSGGSIGYVMECRKAKLKVAPANKFNGSIMYGISLMKNYKIHIVDCPEFKHEQANYTFREVQGIRLDEPIDDFNHLWDAARYACLANLIRK